MDLQEQLKKLFPDHEPSKELTPIKVIENTLFCR